MSAKLGEILVRESLINSQQLREALEYQRSNGGRLGSNLVKLGLISDDVITAVLSRQYGVPSINLDLFQIEADTIKLISHEVALKYSVLPISKVGATLTMAMADPTNVFAMDDIKFMTGLNVEPVIASETSLQDSISKYYSASTEMELPIWKTRTTMRRSAQSSGRQEWNTNGNKGSAMLQSGDANYFESDLNVSLDQV